MKLHARGMVFIPAVSNTMSAWTMFNPDGAIRRWRHVSS